MTRALGMALLGLWLGGCALSHGMEGDASTTTDGGVAPVDGSVAVSDGATASADAGTRLGGPGGLSCGPNRCREAEVCCDDRCGICALDGECPDYDCPDPARP
ncbi:MAG: hypothetical protein H6719_14565 [Sandaracinaceae bacterium]|nr:hypothetical protein [Sandaracinaceae bacterium]